MHAAPCGRRPPRMLCSRVCVPLRITCHSLCTSWLWLAVQQVCGYSKRASTWVQEQRTLYFIFDISFTHVWTCLPMFMFCFVFSFSILKSPFDHQHNSITYKSRNEKDQSLTVSKFNCWSSQKCVIELQTQMKSIASICHEPEPIGMAPMFTSGVLTFTSGDPLNC